MKKFWQLVLVAMFALVLVGCTGGTGGPTGPDKPIGGTEECEHTFEEGICTIYGRYVEVPAREWFGVPIAGFG